MPIKFVIFPFWIRRFYGFICPFSMDLSLERVFGENNKNLRAQPKSVEHNYNPLPARVGVNVQQQLAQRRQQTFAAASKLKEDQREELRAAANAAAPAHVESVKQERREQYQQRVADRIKRYRHYVEVPRGISPWLNMFLHKECSIEDRLLNYNRRHKCLHGRCYTVVSTVSSVLLNGNKTPVYLDLSCACESERITSEHFDRPCDFCSRRTLNVVSDSTFPGDIYHCLFCRNTWYHTIGWSRVRPTHLKVASEKKAPVASTGDRKWETIPAKPEFGEEIRGTLGSWLQKFLDLAVSIKNWIVTKWQSVQAAKRIIETWVSIARALDVIITTIKNRPLTYVLTVWTILTTESNVERMLNVASLFECPIIQMQVKILLCSFGMETIANMFLPGPPLSASKVNGKVQARVRPKSVGPPPPPIYGSDEDSKNPFVERAKEESGCSWFSMLFPVSVKQGLELVRHFNTLSSGWKNLHELVNNFLEMLPDWFLKLFTITDPRKRYAVEAKRKGTPVFDMIESYKEILYGHNCASAEAYEKFKTAWKACDRYITTEFQPDERVQRLHKAFWTNAQNIMTPNTLGSKPVPFVVTLFGVPGTGKSTSWPVVLSGITGCSVEETRAMSYTRDTSSEFFDGYNPAKHPIFVYDDFGHKVDDDAASELMAIVSTADYLPPFASINDLNIGVKGVSFQSPLVVLCSNFETFSHCKQLADKVALQRRLGYVIEWTGVYTGTEGYKLKQAQPDGSLKQINGDMAGGFWSMAELQDYLRLAYVAHMKSQKSVNEKLNKHLAKNTLAKNSFIEQYQSLATELGQYSKTYQQANSAVHYNVATGRIGKPPNSIEAVDFNLDTFTRGGISAQQESGDPFIKNGWMYIVYATDVLGKYLCANQKMILQFIAGVTFGFLSATAIFKTFGLFSKKSKDESGETSTKAAATSRPVFSRHVPSKAEMGDSNDDGVMRKVLRNHVVLVNQDNKFVNGLFLKGRIILTVKHFIRTTSALEIHMHRAEDQKVYEIQMSECKVVEFADADLALVELPPRVQPHVDLTRYVSDEVFRKASDGFITRRNFSNDLTTYNVEVRPANFRLEFEQADGSCRYAVCDIWYTFHHKDGDCGNVIFARQNGNLKIVGLHSSGSVRPSDEGKMSFGTMLHMPEIAEYLKQFSIVSQISREMELPAISATFEDGVSVNKTQFITWSDKHIGTSGHTELRKSELFDVVQEHVTEPALLRIKGDLDPMMKGLRKFGLSTKQFPQDDVDWAVESLTEELLAHKAPEDLDRQLTIDECLNGIPGVVESVDTTTSSGYPFSLDQRTRGAKRQLLVGEPGKWKLGEAAEHDYQRWQTLLQAFVVPSDPYIATLKDERRKIEKVKAGKTRVFCAGSLSSFLHNKRLFGGFCAFLKRIRHLCFSTLGLNRGSREWHEMIESLREVGVCGLDGDQEEWDGRFKAQIALAVTRLFAAFYGIPLNSDRYLEMYTLFLHSIFAHVYITWNVGGKVESFIILVPGLMPSGWFLTFVLNSIVNAILMRVAWIHLVSAPFNDLAYFRTYVREKYAGDDNLLCVASAFVQDFNNVTIAELFLEYDQKYTSATKDGTLVAFRNLEDCTFLKTRTGRLYDLWVPHFDREANLETSNWIRKCDDHDKATEDNCNDVLRNAFFYGREYFDGVRKRILDNKPGYKLISFKSLEAAFLGYGSIPDPFGTFGYTRSNPSVTTLYRSILKA